MKKLVLLMVTMTLMLSAVPVSAKSNADRFVDSLTTVAGQLESRHYRYSGSGSNITYRDLVRTNYKNSKKYGYANCLDYVSWALEHSGNVPWYGGLEVYPCRDDSRTSWAMDYYKKPQTAWMCRGRRTLHNKVYYDRYEKMYYAYGEYYKNSSKTKYNQGEGEYPTLMWLRSKGIVKKGDIIAQWDNPNVRSPYTNKWQTKSNGASGTQSHVLVYTGGKYYRLAQVGAGGTQHVSKYYGKYGYKYHFRAYGITSSQTDRRNRHHNPHVAFIIRLR